MIPEPANDATGSAYVLPIFPLEHAVVPSTIVPLHIFEPRYRQLARDLQTMEDPSFGIVGIERGREVGGHDQRFDVGVVMRVLHAEEFSDGQWALTSVASRRITVTEWLPEDPYPQALVVDRHDQVERDSAEAAAALDRHSLTNEFALLAAMVRRHYPQIDLLAGLDPAEDFDWRTWELVSRSGLGSLDHVSLLRCDSPAERTRLAGTHITERRSLLEALAEGDR